MTPQLDLEERLRQVAVLFKDGVQPPAGLHQRVMARTMPGDASRRPPMLRELALALGLLVVAGLLAFGVAKLRAVQHQGPLKTPPARSQAIPWTAAPMVLVSESAEALGPDAVGTKLQRTVTLGIPLLLPAISSDYQAQVVADNNNYSVDYMSSTRHATVELATGQASLPVPGPQGKRQTRAFRNGQATYQVDSAAPTAPRWLVWTEAGTSQSYWLATDGLGEVDFWQIANSLQTVTPPSAARACRASDLLAVAGGVNGASGQVFNEIVLSNKSASPCQLDGTPKLSFKTKSGQLLPIPQSNTPLAWVTSTPSAALLAANSGDPRLYSSAEGQASVGFSVWDCPADPALASLLITLPNGGGTLTIAADQVGYSWGGQCEGNHVAVLEVSPFAATQPQPVYVDNSSLSVTLKLPASAKTGTTLHYQVILTNASGAPFHFHDCPSYVESMQWPGPKTVASYQLNCGTVGWIEPNASVTFDMALDIRGTGIGSLAWELRSAYGLAQGQASLTVR